MVELQPDVIVDLYLYTQAEGGLKRLLAPAVAFGCPFFFEDEAFDCRLLLNQTGQTLLPGVKAVVPIKFLCPQYVKPRLKQGSRFKLWEGGFIGEGEVLEVVE